MKCRLMWHYIWVFTICQCILSGISGLQRHNSARNAEARKKDHLAKFSSSLNSLNDHANFFLSEVYPLTRFLSKMLTSGVHLIH